MYTLKKIFRFQAAHRLMHHMGKCHALHGHSYKLELHLQGCELNSSGSGTNMLIDFDEIKEAVNPLIKSHLDHHYLNETLQSDSPTAEFIAKWIFEKLKPSIPQLYKVVLWETESCCASYENSKLFSS